jgi:hypothetical protein
MKRLLIIPLIAFAGSAIAASASILLLTRDLETIGLGLLIALLTGIPIIVSTAVFWITRKKGLSAIVFWLIAGGWMVYLLVAVILGRYSPDASGTMALYCLGTSVLPVVTAYLILYKGYNKLVQPT